LAFIVRIYHDARFSECQNHHHHSLLHCFEQPVTKVHIHSAYQEFVAYNLKILRRRYIFNCVLPSTVFVRHVKVYVWSVSLLTLTFLAPALYYRSLWQPNSKEQLQIATIFLFCIGKMLL